MPALNLPLKACTPTTLARVMIADGQLTCEISWDSGNGQPNAVMLLPVKRDGPHWIIAPRDGGTLASTEPITTANVDCRYGVLSSVSDTSATVAIAWPTEPAQTTPAMLLLLHNQMRTMGTWVIPTGHHPTLGPGLGNAVFHGPSLGVMGLHMDAIAAPALIDPPVDADAQAADDDAATIFLRASPSEIDRGVIQWPAAPKSSPPPPATAFALGSCQYPATLLDRGPYKPWWSDADKALGPAERSLDALAATLEADPGIGFTVLAGDQVYVDATAGLFDPANLLDRFTFAYQAMKSNKGFQRLTLLANRLILPVLDDHEIVDNWEPAKPARPDAIEQQAGRGIRNYLDNEGGYWPAPCRKDTRRLWEQRIVGDWNFFFVDTRTARTGRWIGNWRTASIVDPRQEAALLRWIDDPLSVQGVEDVAPPPPADPTEAGAARFIVSPSILLPRLLSLRNHPTMALQADSWCGYPASLHRILARLFVARANGVVFLSGDEHLSCAARIEISRDDSDDVLITHSIHSSGLYCPFPFANSRQEDFIDDDDFSFDDPLQAPDRVGSPLRYRCKVTTTFPPLGDGFAILRPPHPTDASRQLRVEFHRPGATRPFEQLLDL